MEIIYDMALNRRDRRLITNLYIGIEAEGNIIHFKVGGNIIVKIKFADDDMLMAKAEK